MAGTLSKAGQVAAKEAALDFLEAYEKRIKTAACKAVKGPGQDEFKALGFFKGRDRTSHYQPEAFSDARRGCETATVWIHPHIEWKDVELGGSKTDSSVPAALAAIGPLFPGEKFISGHMINADFGGDHTRPGNQTVLTHAANSQHDFDDAVKTAAKRMGVAVYEMYRASNVPTVGTYLGTLYNKWVIKVNVAVDDETWYDTYKDDTTLKKDPAVKKKYPLNAVATKITFTAEAVNTPGESEIAQNLRIPLGKMGLISTALSEFNQFMDEAADFELNQEPPPDFKSRSQVTTRMTPVTGTPVLKASTTTPYTAKAKKGTAKPPKPVVVTVPCSLKLTGGGKINLRPGEDNTIDVSTPGFPWATNDTDLEDDFLFYITTDHSSGSAVVLLEDAGGTKITVNGTLLKKSKLSLNDGEKIRVNDSHAPNGTHYEFTFEQH